MPAHAATPAAKQPLGCVAQVSSKRFLIMTLLAKDHKEVGSGIEARLHQCMGIAYIRLDNHFESPSESSMYDNRISGWGVRFSLCLLWLFLATSRILCLKMVEAFCVFRSRTWNFTSCILDTLRHPHQESFDSKRRGG